MPELCDIPAPLFRDPIHDGAADPVPIYNHLEKSWWICYTNRRANVEGPGFAWMHGTDIGVASSADHGRTWLYRGTLRGLEFEPGRNTFWAPEILFHDGIYHMYCSYVPGIPTTWQWPRNIIHYTSRNLWDWHFESVLKLNSQRVIDACVFRLPTGRWRMWYKDEQHNSHTYTAESDNLYHWVPIGPAITDCAHEGPNVFSLGGHYWMITDPWQGLGVYHSDDLENWQRQDNILLEGGTRTEDSPWASHADVLVVRDRAYILYFTHPGCKALEDRSATFATRRTVLQAAALEIRDGKLTCDRNAPTQWYLPDLSL